MFDIESFISKYTEIESKNSKEIFLKECPFCGKPGKHRTTFSVAKIKEVYHCFRCGQSGKWVALVMKLAGISFAEAKSLMGEELDLRPTQRQEESKEKFILHLPPKSGWTVRSESYILDRGISRSTIRDFGLYYCRRGFYKERIIIPVVEKGEIVTFQARAILKDMEPRYRSPKNSPKNDLWFNLNRHRPGQRIVIVEGPFDVMKLHNHGIFAICPLGKTISQKQRILLTRLETCGIALLQDRDALPFVARVWKDLSRHVKTTLLPLWDVEDPAELTLAEARETLRSDFSNPAHLDLQRMRVWRKRRVC